MATKAEQYKAEAQRAARAKTSTETASRTAPKTASRGRSPRRATDRSPNQASHNEAPVRGRKSSYELEISATSRPSRLAEALLRRPRVPALPGDAGLHRRVVVAGTADAASPLSSPGTGRAVYAGLRMKW